MEQAVIASSTAGGNLPQYLSYLESLVNASCQEIAFSNEEWQLGIYKWLQSR